MTQGFFLHLTNHNMTLKCIFNQFDANRNKTPKSILYTIHLHELVKSVFVLNVSVMTSFTKKIHFTCIHVVEA